MKRIKIVILAFFVFFFPIVGFAKENNITMYLFHGDGCPHCAEEMDFIPSLKKYKNLKIKKYETWYNEENADLLKKVLEAYSINRIGVPATIIGDTIIMGFGEGTGNRIERAIEYYSNHPYIDQVSRIQKGTFKNEEFNPDNDFMKEEKEKQEDLTVTVPIFGKVNLERVSLLTASVIIGFIDGFNPCAMWVLLFLISILLGMKNRKRMWILGLTFLLTSAVVYLFIMLSWLQIAVKITTVIWIRNIIAIISLIGGIWNLRSFFKSQDSGCEVVDDKKRKNIIKKIRKFTSEKSFILALLGVMGLAVSVNLVELACSAGLPLVFSELLVLNHVSDSMKFLYTLLYIVFFLIDDIIVFLIAMFTMKVTGISTKYNKYSHLLGGIIMVIIGLLLLFKPGWLMFQFQ
ncbi:MAG: hypothetical protein IKE70_05920 [Bacilli bacterium]|nr:hypothetical protein [Bacilli bacterium]